MNLLETPQVAEVIKQASTEMLEMLPRATMLVQDALQKVVQWKFATDEYYNPLPLYHEINKFKKGRIIKDKALPLSLQPGVHEFGFDAAGQLILARHLIGQNESLGVNVKLYTYSPTSIKYSNVRYYPKGNFLDKFISFGQYEKFSDEIAVEVVVGSNYNTSATFLHTNKAGFIDRVERQATGWNGATTYTPLFDDKGIKEVLIGDVKWWKRAGK